MDDLLAEFVAESREMLEALGGEIVAWEADPADRARLDAIFRFMHTVKGNCGFFDFPRLQALSHAAEDALADVRAGRRRADAALVNAVLAVVDRISDMIAAIDRGEALPDSGDAPLIAALDQDADGAEVLAPIASSGGPGPVRAVAQRSVRLPVELLDRVMSGVSDMVLARNDLARRLREMPGAAEVQAPFDRLTAIIADVRDAMARARMQRIDHLFGALPRMVRDLSSELGKQVMVDVDGGEVELDREMIEMIRDPLTHIIRNAIDHGIEPPAERQAAGKREIGLLTASARQSGNRILIDIADDGRGIDGARLVDKAIAAGILDPERAARLTDRERSALIFGPGLSTAEAVTAISGRGVGMDVVRANVERIGGAIEVDSAPGQGTRVTLRVPLTLSIIPALTVGAGDQRFAIPRSSIEEIVHAGEDAVEIAHLGGAMLARVRDRRLPCVGLARLLGLADAAEDRTRALIVLRLTGGERFVLAVDQLFDHEDLVVKPVAPAVMATGLYAGTTLTDDGRPILLLEIGGIAEAGGLQLEAQERLEPAAGAGADHEAVPVVLFVGLDGRRRAMRMAVVERIEEIAAGAIDAGAGGLRLIADGRLLPLAGAAPGADFGGPLTLFRLSDGLSEIAYVARAVIDIRPMIGDIVPAAGPGEIEGVTLIDGEAAELVDPHWLFAHHAVAALPAAPPTCRLPAGDPWMQNFLRPLVEAAGWRVVAEDEAARADLEIAAPGAGVSPIGAGRVIRLRAMAEEAPDVPDSIYRYDREGLLAALAVGGRR